jgi:cysteine-rich repeat protein
VCVDAACGNSFVDLPSSDFPFEEQCDDGNTISGDGCSADCTSTERCGNSAIDLIYGETCDDGNLLSRDGCSSTCGTEAPQWQIWTFPIERINPAVTYDARRGRVVMFGGFRSPVATQEEHLDDLWELDADFELQPSPLPRPFPREGAAMTYDLARGELVVFGGQGLAAFADTHTWTGGAWAVKEVPGPSPRGFAAIAYDVVGRRAVLFGGLGAGGVALADTWVWDGEAWTELVVPTAPPASSAPSMAYDPTEDLLLLATGGQTWSLRRGDTAGWKYLFDAPANAKLVFDPVSHTVVAFTNPTDIRFYRKTPNGWVLDSNTIYSPASAHSFVVVPNLQRERLIAIGVQSGAPPVLVVLEWDGSAWAVSLGAASRPGAVDAVTVDTRRGRVIALESTDMWSFTSGRWAQLTTMTPMMTPRLIAYDESRDRVVMFNGSATWEWDGQRWINVSPAVGPTTAGFRRMVYDRARQRIVLVGGTAETMTWLWDGQSWQPLATPTELHGRQNAAVAYDPIRERVVLFSGVRGGNPQTDTWVLEPAGWVQQHPAGSIPAPRVLAGFAWDAARGRLVLYGGVDSDDTFTFGDAWEWDGTRWTPVPTLTVINQAPKAVSAPDGGGIFVVMTMGLQKLVWRGTEAVETCALPFDADGDERIGCLDPDCWPVCAPLCPPGAPGCSTQPPYCGDQQCGPIENGYACSSDCPAPATVCGDAVCAGEMTSCPGDCPP